jgi:hypothetical protein
VVSALMVLEIQSNKAHRLQTTDYTHVKSGGKNGIQARILDFKNWKDAQKFADELMKKPLKLFIKVPKKPTKKTSS